MSFLKCQASLLILLLCPRSYLLLLLLKMDPWTIIFTLKHKDSLLVFFFRSFHSLYYKVEGWRQVFLVHPAQNYLWMLEKPLATNSLFLLKIF